MDLLLLFGYNKATIKNIFGREHVNQEQTGVLFTDTFFGIFGAKFCFRDTCMILLFRISVQLSVEPLITYAVCNSQHA